MKKLVFLAVLCTSIVLNLSSCKPATPEIESSRLTIDLKHLVDGQILEGGVYNYQTASGHDYSVSRLEYYISRVSLIDQNGKTQNFNKTHYVNFLDSNTWTIQFESVPFGNYNGIEFNFGLAAADNISGSLPPTQENIGMNWPDPMGGGYHFMKLEGKYVLGASKKGYAIHLGTNICEMRIALALDLDIEKEPSALGLEMNLNEWFRNPANYDFELDGYYTMGDTTLMTKIRDNGMNAFKILKQ
jgi:hypothetical protein